MSLVGSLEDLGLADILQIVSLSRKSGMLYLRSDGGDGRILLRDGLVQGAAIKGEPEDLRGLLVGGGFVDAGDFDRARDSRDGDESLDDAVTRGCGLPPEHLESLRREHVEHSVMRMFTWRSGEFSFEICSDFAEDSELLLPSGLNTQYLAMEATRLGDERNQAPEWSAAPDADMEGVESTNVDVDDGPVFSGEEPDAEPVVEGEFEAEAVETLALVAARQADESDAAATLDEPIDAGDDVDESAGIGSVVPMPDESEADDTASLVPVNVAPSPAVTDVPVAIEPSEDARDRDPGPEGRAVVQSAKHLVAVDLDLSSLEWLKASVESLFQRVHIFQRTEIAIDRIRQYLVRGELPIVLVSDEASRDASGEDGFIQRLRALAPTMTILALRPEGRQAELSPELDGLVLRPASPSSDPDRWHVHESVAEQLRESLRNDHGTERSARRAQSRTALTRLKNVSDRLRDPSTQGEVLSVVLEFAAESFCRVVMFMLRDDSVAGIAQIGLAPTGGPEDEELRALELGPDEMPELFRAALERRSAVRSTLGGPLDRALAMKLGAATPTEAYAAPIESGGCAVAILYADNLPEERPIPDTTALEIVLHEAGLALDRAHLERALAERDD